MDLSEECETSLGKEFIVISLPETSSDNRSNEITHSCSEKSINTISDTITIEDSNFSANKSSTSTDRRRRKVKISITPSIEEIQKRIREEEEKEQINLAEKDSQSTAVSASRARRKSIQSVNNNKLNWCPCPERIRNCFHKFWIKMTGSETSEETAEGSKYDFYDFDSTRLRPSSTADDIEQGIALDNDDGNGGTGSGTEDGDTLTKKHVRHKNRRPLIRRIITYIRNAIYGVRFASSIDSELEELDNLPPRYRPDSLSALCRATKFSEAEIKRIYRGFKAECPTGVVREDTFKIIYASFFPQGANSGSYAHYVFNTLDQDHSGLVSFEEFVQGLSVLSRGTIDEKLRWTFSLYDINGDGYITKEEMTDIVTAIFELVGSRDTMEGESERIKVKVDRLFEKMDVNRDGVVTLEEFLDCCHKDEAISKSITVFDTTF